MRISSAIIACVIIAASAAPAFAKDWGEIKCDKAQAADEKAICGSIELVQRDAQMSVEYGLLRGFLAMGGRGALTDEQHEWLKSRRACGGDVMCLRKAYEDRIKVLETGLGRVGKFGPF